MCVNVVCVVISFVLVQKCTSQTLRVPPRVETNNMFLDSYIPPTMQILAHLTELMKYDLRPTTAPPYGSTTTSTMRPTPAHRPGIYAPYKPPGPVAYFSSFYKGQSYDDYIESLKQTSGPNYFDRYKFYLEPTENPIGAKPRILQNSDQQTIEYYFGRNFANLLNIATKIEPVDVPNDIDNQVQEFSKLYDDSDFRYILLRKKQVPPTRAYVTLLSLYDILSKEAKRLGFNKYQGIHDRVLKELAEYSTGTSSYQLHHVLKKLIERDESKKPELVKKLTQLINDLDDDESYINVALRYIPPLLFVV